MLEKYSEWPFGTAQFREYVNEHANTLIILSSEMEHENYWNCICSAMDWMDLAVEKLENSQISKLDWREYSLQIYMHISYIDIIWESIKKLHSLLIDKGSTPFEGDNSIFQDERLGLDDNRFLCIFEPHLEPTLLT